METQQTLQTSGRGLADPPWGLVSRCVLNFREQNSNGMGWGVASQLRVCIAGVRLSAREREKVPMLPIV